MQQHVIEAMEKRLVDAISTTDTATLVEQWMPLTLKGIEQWQIDVGPADPDGGARPRRKLRRRTAQGKPRPAGKRPPAMSTAPTSWPRRRRAGARRWASCGSRVRAPARSARGSPERPRAPRDGAAAHVSRPRSGEVHRPRARRLVRRAAQLYRRGSSRAAAPRRAGGVGGDARGGAGGARGPAGGARRVHPPGASGRALRPHPGGGGGRPRGCHDAGAGPPGHAPARRRARACLPAWREGCSRRWPWPRPRSISAPTRTCRSRLPRVEPRSSRRSSAEMRRTLADGRRRRAAARGADDRRRRPPNSRQVEPGQPSGIARRRDRHTDPGDDARRLEVQLELGGLPVVLLDTAGLREATDPIEQEGIRARAPARATADLRLVVVDLPAAAELHWPEPEGRDSITSAQQDRSAAAAGRVDRSGDLLRHRSGHGGACSTCWACSGSGRLSDGARW